MWIKGVMLGLKVWLMEALRSVWVAPINRLVPGWTIKGQKEGRQAAPAVCLLAACCFAVFCLLCHGPFSLCDAPLPYYPALKLANYGLMSLQTVG